MGRDIVYVKDEKGQGFALHVTEDRIEQNTVCYFLDSLLFENVECQWQLTLETNVLHH